MNESALCRCGGAPGKGLVTEKHSTMRYACNKIILLGSTSRNFTYSDLPFEFQEPRD